MIITTLSLTHCSFAPTYHRPTLEIPPSYKEQGKWLSAKPKALNDTWWTLYSDATLNDLEQQVNVSNQTIKVAFERYEQAKASANVVRSALFPNITGIANANRTQMSKTITNPFPITLTNDYLVAADLTYEVDVWGKIRNMLAAAKSLARASKADLGVVQLSMQAELATDYFMLRSADASQLILDNIVKAYKKGLFLTRQRFHGGLVSAIELDQAENQLNTAETFAADMHLQRHQLEHAIATLIGKPPASFELEPVTHFYYNAVLINPNLPSTLLERRPDIASAEEQVRAANATIGVARAAFFPDINIAADIGFESKALSSLFKAPSLIWALGPSTSASAFTQSGPLVNQTIFDGGRLINLDRQAWSHFSETVANYRQVVLNALQNVEDNLTAMRQLNIENKKQSLATAAAERALQQEIYRYRGDLASALDVITLQVPALQNELASINIRTRHQLASVQLIKALGGGWIQAPFEKALLHKSEEGSPLPPGEG